MITRLSQFFAVLEAHRPGFTAKSSGNSRGVILRGGATPVEVVYEILAGFPAKSVFTAASLLFGSKRRASLVTAAANAPNLLYLYRRLFVSTWKASGSAAAYRVQNEWQSILGVRGQMLRALGLNDTLRGNDRLPGNLRLITTKKEV